MGPQVAEGRNWAARSVNLFQFGPLIMTGARASLGNFCERLDPALCPRVFCGASVRALCSHFPLGTGLRADARTSPR